MVLPEVVHHLVLGCPVFTLFHDFYYYTKVANHLKKFLRYVLTNGSDKIFDLIDYKRLGIPQERVAKRLGVDQKTVHNHLGKMPELAYLLKADLSKGFTVSQVVQKHDWTEPMVWSLTLEGKAKVVQFPTDYNSKTLSDAHNRSYQPTET